MKLWIIGLPKDSFKMSIKNFSLQFEIFSKRIMIHESNGKNLMIFEQLIYVKCGLRNIRNKSLNMLFLVSFMTICFRFEMLEKQLI